MQGKAAHAAGTGLTGRLAIPADNMFNPLKKRSMKKFALVLICMLTLGTAMAFALNDKVITVNSLPATAQQFLKKHFKNAKIAIVKKENKLIRNDYEVTFANGNKIEFDSDGNWEEIDCKATAVPASAVPAKITQYVKANYPQAKVLQIDKKRSGYEVKLSNRMELEFNKNFQLTDIDND